MAMEDEADVNFSSSNATYFGNYTSEQVYAPAADGSSLVVLVAKTIAFVINIAIAIIGNSIVITIILKNKHMRSTTYYYLMNLAIADIIIAAFSEWTFLGGQWYPNSWPFGHFMCKTSSFVQGVSVHVSILTLTVVAGDRYIAILHPIKSRVVKRKAWLVIAVVWALAAIINIPFVLYTHYYVHVWEDGVVQVYCYEHWGKPADESADLDGARVAYTIIIFVITYAVPLLIMSVVYISIGVTLSSRSSSGPGIAVKTTVSVQDRARKKVVKMMLVVVTTFALCWLPYHVYTLYTTTATNFSQSSVDPNIFFIFIWLGYANSAMNPFIYCGFNENFRRGFRDAFTGRWFFKRPQHAKLSNGGTTKTVTTTMMSHTDHNDPNTLESML